MIANPLVPKQSLGKRFSLPGGNSAIWAVWTVCNGWAESVVVA